MTSGRDTRPPFLDRHVAMETREVAGVCVCVRVCGVEGIGERGGDRGHILHFEHSLSEIVQIYYVGHGRAALPQRQKLGIRQDSAGCLVNNTRSLALDRIQQAIWLMLGAWS